VLVLDLTTEMGQYAGKLLADMGARVIKVEQPGGDPARRIGPFAGDSGAAEDSLFWWHYNTSKLGVTLDIRKPEGAALLRRLAQRADVLLESSPPGHMASLGLGYEHLSAVNPRLIFTSITPFGQDGPYRDFLATDLTAMAMGGPMASSGYSQDEEPDAPPIRGTGYQGYQTGSNWAAIGTLVALAHRDRTGEGQHVDSALHEALAVTTEAAMPHYFYLGRAPMRQTGRHHAQSPTPRTQWRAADGKMVCAFNVPRNPQAWQALADWAAERGVCAEVHSDPKYREAFLSGARATPEIDAVWNMMGAIIATLPAEEAYQGGQQRRFPWGIIRSPDENVHDPHLEERGYFFNVPHSERGRSYVYPGPAAKMYGTPVGIRSRAPRIGEHNAQVYGELMGLTPAQVEGLRERGVV
jgi:crotonobetainyl-CoA:carnitine CoA-transferase CaiB-like acyl-CoA transferase